MSDDCCSSAAEQVAVKPVLWIALIVNATMFVVEIVASNVGDSMSLRADALDFFSDAANYAITLMLIGSPLAMRARATLLKGASMGLIGIWVIYSAVQRAVDGSDPAPLVMGSVALVALFANVSVAALLYRFRANDSNLRSVWLCSRNDAIGNVAVLVAAAGVLATSTRWLDLGVAAIIAMLAITAAFSIIRQAVGELRGPTLIHSA
jgi:Co/Zn/Cd efflux system component